MIAIGNVLYIYHEHKIVVEKQIVAEVVSV